MNLSGLLFLAVICAVHANPTDSGLKFLIRAKRQADTNINQNGFFGNTKKLVEELVQNLGKAGQEAKNAVDTFGEGLRAQVRHCRTRILNELNALRARVNEAVESVTSRLTESATAVTSCVGLQREAAEQLYQRSLNKATTCAESRLEEASNLVNKLSDMANVLETFASEAYANLSSCAETNSNLLNMGSCMGNVALQTELKGAVLLTQTGLLIGRINFYLTTLPAALEFCAGTGLMSAGVGTARIVIDIGSCSASTAISTLINGTPQSLPVLEPGPAVPESPFGSPETAILSSSSAVESSPSTESTSAAIVSAVSTDSNAENSLFNVISALKPRFAF